MYTLMTEAGEKLNNTTWSDRDAMLEALRAECPTADFGITEGTILDDKEELVATFGEFTGHTIYIYSNETGKQVANHEDVNNIACERWADHNYGSNDFHYSYADVAVSNAV